MKNKALGQRIRLSEAAAYGCSRRGAVHVHRGLPCQDAWGIDRFSENGTDALILAVADGHGARVHDLSEIGSRLAIRAATAAAHELLRGYVEDGDLKQLAIAFRVKFPKLVLTHWHNLILDDARERMPDVQLDVADLGALYHRYGSTLLMTVTVDDKIIVSSVGDGDVVLVRPDGEVDLHLQQDAPELEGTMTFSLASKDAEMFFQSVSRPRENGGVVIQCTDGMINSFVDESYFLGFCVGLQERIRNCGFEHMTGSVPSWLDYFSANGSGDDMTLVVAWLEGEPPQPETKVGELLTAFTRKAVRRMGRQRPGLLRRCPVGFRQERWGHVRPRRLKSSCVDYSGGTRTHSRPRASGIVSRGVG